MKKILIILLTIPLIFGSCEKEDDSPNSNSNTGNPIGNTPLGTTGYFIDDYNDNIWKTTDSGNNWTEVTDIRNYFNTSSSVQGSISFVN